MALAEFPEDAVFPLVVFGGQVALPAVEPQPQHRQVLGVVSHGAGRYQEVVVILHLVFHERAVLEVGIERFLLLQLAVVEAQHVELAALMLEQDLLPAAGETVHVVRPLRRGDVVKLPVQEAVLSATLLPFVGTPLVVVLVEEGLLVDGQHLAVVLIARYDDLVVGVGVLVVAVERQVAKAEEELVGRQHLVGEERPDVAIHDVQVAIAPVVVLRDVFLQGLSVDGLEVAEDVGPVEDDGELDDVLNELAEVFELHLVDDDVLCGLYVGVRKKHEVDRWVAQG